jgi:penicillin-binding protein 2
MERLNVIERLSSMLDNPMDKLESIIEKNGSYFLGEILLKSDLNRENALMIEGQVGNIEGVYLKPKNSRKYLDGEYFSHILGYVGKISPETLSANKNYSISDSIGKSGIELYYEDNLRGINGEKRFEFGKYEQEDGAVSIKNPEPGKNILLTVDYGLQKKLYDALSRELKSLNLKSGAGIIINPSNGEVLSLVSFPSFDSNIFNKSLQRGNPETILMDPASPLLNRVISGTYPPGSTIKPLMGSALLQEGVVYPYEKIYAEKSISIVNQYNPDIVYTFPDWKEHGWVNIIDAIAYSSNVYFYTFGGGYKDTEGLGINKIRDYLEKFNFGKIINIDLFGEASGLLPDPKWKEEIKNENWYIGDTYHISIGQGDIAITPLQLVSAIGYIANSGQWYKPHLAKKIIDGDQVYEISPVKITDGFIERHNIEIVKQGMRKAVTDGSARLLSNLSVAVAGKTGTAQFGNQGKTHAWFTGFAPYDNPEIAITILIEGGGEGSSVAVPVAKEVLEWYYNEHNI